MSIKLSLAALLALAIAGTTGCSADAQEDENVDSDSDDLLKKTALTSSWSYRGLMPELESPKLTVSLKGHTVHVQGYLPRNVAVSSLPFHVRTEEDASGRTIVHAAYPIATVNTHSVTVGGLPARNPEPFDYEMCGGDNHHASNGVGAFGGFPFMEYVCRHRDHDGRIRGGIAFHGPITSQDVSGADYWYLQRGPVSHACNRMLGEHVLELAHITGFDHGKRGFQVKVIAGYDTFKGKTLDVDYPATGWTRPTDAVVFPIWQAVSRRADGSTQLDMPQWACETSRCASMPANARDAHTGQRL